ncbi:MAG TPA: ROK family transcriptional regulator [Candidatus Aerophobetes bacterium]|uniref:ROK family transcriptional regulator n=1 Tax=Aerophobetes bacterium TaxID=2030807 RepID=A0A7C1MC15_UNCAE|nr:ROK family transcriptional regulator [Candidatus Aerophobetes bacterium]
MTDEPYTLTLTKQPNRSLILNLIGRNGPISRGKLARRTRLSPPTISRVVDSLIQEKLVLEVGTAEFGKYGSGRRPILLQFNSKVGYVIGADVGEIKIRAAIANLKGEIIREITAPTLPHKGRDTTIRQLTATIHQLLNEARVTPHQIKMMGLSAPSPIDRKTGTIILASTIAGWRNVPLKTIIQEEFGVPTFVENNVNMAAVGEKRYGAGQGAKNLIYVAVSTGIGVGIMIDGRLFYGTNNLAGEISHMVIEKDGWQKDYGLHGCLETFISGDEMVKWVKKSLGEGHKSIISSMVEEDIEAITAETVFIAAGQGDEFAAEIVTHISRYIGVAMANLVSILDPEIVILGDDIVAAGELPLKIILGIVKKLAPTLPHIALSQLGNKAVVYGNIAMATDKAFKKLTLSSSS